jgi:hypothetical protein
LTPEIEPELHAYLATVFKGGDSPTLIINDCEKDYVHALSALSRK